jgi:hypothetical protein
MLSPLSALSVSSALSDLSSLCILSALPFCPLSSTFCPPNPASDLYDLPSLLRSSPTYPLSDSNLFNSKICLPCFLHYLLCVCNVECAVPLPRWFWHHLFNLEGLLLGCIARCTPDKNFGAQGMSANVPRHTYNALHPHPKDECAQERIQDPQGQIITHDPCTPAPTHYIVDL